MNSNGPTAHQPWRVTATNRRFIGEYRATSGGRGLHHHPIWIDTRFCESSGACPDSWLDAQVYASFVTPVYFF